MVPIAAAASAAVNFALIRGSSDLGYWMLIPMIAVLGVPMALVLEVEVVSVA